MTQAAKGSLGWVVAGGLALFMLGRLSAESSNTSSATQPFATASPTPSQGSLVTKYAASPTVNCRAEASATGAIVRRYNRNDLVTVTLEESGWSRLDQPPCWIKSSLLVDAPVSEAPRRVAETPRSFPAQRLAAVGDVYFANCSAARAAGAAPIRVGEPGYSRRLDRDGDGVGCE